MKDKKSTIITVVFIVIVAVGVFAAYFGLRNISKKRAEDKAKMESKTSEFQLISEIDIDNNYPETVRTLLKLYARIVTCMHNETLTDSQLSTLQMQLRKLFDDELIAKNPVAEHFNALKLEIMNYDDNSRSIESYLVDSAANAEYSTVDEKKYCRMIINFKITEKSYVGAIYEEFILRQDDSGRWKILGWRRVDADGVPVK